MKPLAGCQEITFSNAVWLCAADLGKQMGSPQHRHQRDCGGLDKDEDADPNDNAAFVAPHRRPPCLRSRASLVATAANRVAVLLAKAGKASIVDIEAFNGQVIAMNAGVSGFN
jgi:hypothetical protein